TSVASWRSARPRRSSLDHSTPIRKRCSTWCQSPAGSTGRSWRENRRIRPAYRPGAASTRGVRRSRPAGHAPPAWRSAVEARTWASWSYGRDTSRPAIWRRSVRPTAEGITWPASRRPQARTSRSATERGGPRGPRRPRARSAGPLVPLRFQDAQDRLHLAIPHGDLTAGPARGGEKRAEVRFSHLSPGLEVAHTPRERLGLTLGLVASLAREPHLLARGAERGSKRG